MMCPRCRQRMTEQRGTHHKRKKYMCSTCGKVRFAQLKDRPGGMNTKRN